MNRLAYLTVEAAMFLGIWIVAYSTSSWHTFKTKRLIFIIAALYCLWVALDLVAVARGVFWFPSEGNLPLRILTLPLEEHLFFPLHTATIWMVLLLLNGTKRSD